MSEKSNRAIAILVAILVVVVLVSCASLVAGSTVFGAEPVVSPTRRPIKTPTSAPDDPDNFLYLPLIEKSGEYRPTSAPTETPEPPKHDYPSEENCRIEASPMEDLIDMCCSMYGRLCEYIPTTEAQ